MGAGWRLFPRGVFQRNAVFVLVLVCASAGACLSFSGTAAAQDSEDLQWNPRWTRFTTMQYMITAGMGGGLLATNQLMPARTEPNWRSEILLDRPAGVLLGAESPTGRRRASRISDHFSLGLMLYPFADSLLVAGLFHGNFDVGYQMALISLQGVFAAKLVTGLTKELVGRARPDAGACELGDELACGSSNSSFVSGHTTSAFVGAGLICAHHQNLRLYGSETASALACGLSLGAATTAGTLRVVARRHHLSDVLAGAAVGLAAGYLLPNLINYDFGGSDDDDDASAVLAPMAAPDTVGLTYFRSF